MVSIIDNPAPPEAKTPTRQQLTDELRAADDAYTAAVQAAVGRYGTWGDVQAAGQAVRQCRSALKAATK